MEKNNLFFRGFLLSSYDTHESEECERRLEVVLGAACHNAWTKRERESLKILAVLSTCTVIT